jgi:hypothetical protein
MGARSARRAAGVGFGGLGRAAVGAVALASLASAGTARGQYAAWLNEIDFDRLVAEYGGTQANGSNVPVTIVESGGYPDAADGRFAGKTLTPRTGAAGPTAHATTVGALFFGNTTGFSQRSVAPAIPNVDMYTTSWSGAFFLTPGTVPPLTSPNNSRVATHAYGETTSLSNLARIDWVVERDDFVQVVGYPGISGHGNGFNSIAVAPSAGLSGAALNGTVQVSPGTPYVAGRYRPDVTGPRGTTSDSIGAVGGLAALLVSRGKTTASHHDYAARPGYTVTSGDTSEVVKAALMAGALRHTTGNTDTPNITDYRAAASNRTANGLDKRFGAGVVNVYNSYRIIDAGEANSAEDGGLGQVGGGIGASGFDYDASFGGAAGSNATATYAIASAASDRTLSATLAWNLRIAGTNDFGNFDAAATLYDLDLQLIDVTAGGATVAGSFSTIDNTETVWTDLAAGHAYELRVVPGEGQAAFDWDYGLAWHVAPAVPEPSGALLGMGVAGLLAARRGRRGTGRRA